VVFFRSFPRSERDRSAIEAAIPGASPNLTFALRLESTCMVKVFRCGPRHEGWGWIDIGPRWKTFTIAVIATAAMNGSIEAIADFTD
jgi:hypothetical protein